MVDHIPPGALVFVIGFTLGRGLGLGVRVKG